MKDDRIDRRCRTAWDEIHGMGAWDQLCDAHRATLAHFAEALLRAPLRDLKITCAVGGEAYEMVKLALQWLEPIARLDRLEVEAERERVEPCELAAADAKDPT